MGPPPRLSRAIAGEFEIRIPNFEFNLCSPAPAPIATHPHPRWQAAHGSDRRASRPFRCVPPSADAAPPAQINIGIGNNQRGEINALLPRPLEAWVSDKRALYNRSLGGHMTAYFYDAKPGNYSVSRISRQEAPRRGRFVKVPGESDDGQAPVYQLKF